MDGYYFYVRIDGPMLVAAIAPEGPKDGKPPHPREIVLATAVQNLFSSPVEMKEWIEMIRKFSVTSVTAALASVGVEAEFGEPEQLVNRIPGVQ